MSGRRKRAKVNIQNLTPEMPSFLKKLHERAEEHDDAERKRLAALKKANRPKVSEGHENEPSVVQLEEGDLTEEDYRRAKEDLDKYTTIIGQDDEEAEAQAELSDDFLAEETPKQSSSKVESKSCDKDKESRTSRHDNSNIKTSSSKAETQKSKQPTRNKVISLTYSSSESESESDDSGDD